MTSSTVALLEIPADSRFIAEARNFVVNEARRCGWFADNQLDDLRIVVSESVTNALRAQAGRDSHELITVRTELFPNRLEVSVIDSAGGFDVPEGPLPVPEPDPRRESGFGLPIMEALSDEIHVDAHEDGTVVRVVVYRERDARSETN